MARPGKKSPFPLKTAMAGAILYLEKVGREPKRQTQGNLGTQSRAPRMFGVGRLPTVFINI